MMDTARIQRLRDLADQALGYSARLAQRVDAGDLLHLLERAERMAAFPPEERDAAAVQPFLDTLLAERDELQRRAALVTADFAAALLQRGQSIIEGDESEDVIEWTRDLLALACVPQVEIAPLTALVRARPDRFLVAAQLSADRMDVESPDDDRGLLRLFAETPIAALRAEAALMRPASDARARLRAAFAQGASRLGVSEQAWADLLKQADFALRPESDGDGTVVWLHAPVAPARMAADTPSRLPPVEAWRTVVQVEGIALNLSEEQREDGVVLWLEIVRLDPTLPPLSDEGVVDVRTDDGGAAWLGTPQITADSWLARLASVPRLTVQVGDWQHPLTLQQED